MPRHADVLTIAVTDGTAYWRVAALRYHRGGVVFVSLEPEASHHWSYHPSGTVTRKGRLPENRRLSEHRRASPWPLRTVEPFVHSQLLDLTQYAADPKLKPGRRGIVLHSQELPTGRISASVDLVPPLSWSDLALAVEGAAKLIGARGIVVVVREEEPWAVVSLTPA